MLPIYNVGQQPNEKMVKKAEQTLHQKQTK